jgi:aquaglyceroporin related protein, other eukaryote
MSIFFGLGATLSVNLSADQSTHYGSYESSWYVSHTHRTLQSMGFNANSSWAWGFAFMLGIYTGGGVSGAHMNPSISISLSIFRGFPWSQCGIYIVAQFLGAMFAATVAFYVFRDAILYQDPHLQTTYTSFFSSPQDWVTLPGAFMDQFVAGAVTMVAVLAMGDDQNNPPGAGLHAFILGLFQVALKMSLGYNTGASLNPASDFGPRVICTAVGYSTKDTFGNIWWFYGPWVSAITGSTAGCAIYDLFIFVGSESPVNYRVPGKFRKRVQSYWRIRKAKKTESS